MKNGFVKVAAISPCLKVADVTYNTSKILEKIEEAYKEKAGILVFPELCITGYTCGDLFMQKPLLKAAKEALFRIADDTAGREILVFVGLPFEKDNRLYDVTAVLWDGHILALLPKRELPGYGEFSENRYFAKGNQKAENIVLSQDGEDKEIPFGSNILFCCRELKDLVIGCEMGNEGEALISTGVCHVMNGATLLVNPAARSLGVGKEEKLLTMLKAESKRLTCGYITAGAGMGESTQDMVMSGFQAILEDGELLAGNSRLSQDVIYSEIDVEKLSMMRMKRNAYADEKTDEYKKIYFSLEWENTRLTRNISKYPFIMEGGENEKACMDEILEIQARGLARRMEHIGTKVAVLGISGGLDSTLALLVTAKAFDMLSIPRSQIKAVTMPCFGTTDRTYENACTMSKVLGAELKEIDIKDAVMVHFENIGHNRDDHNVTYENAQARERTQVLMDIANDVGGIVVGTGDFSELALGFATYNGDHMSMYGVNANIPKTLLRHLVKYYADTCKEEELTKVLYDVLDTPVSPELLPPVEGEIAQKTEDLVGPYELHDFVLYYMMNYGFGPKKIYRLEQYCFGDEYDPETIKKWLKTFYRRFFSQQFKRSCLPDGPKVFEISLSPRGDWHMPSDGSARVWMSEAEGL